MMPEKKLLVNEKSVCGKMMVGYKWRKCTKGGHIMKFNKINKCDGDDDAVPDISEEILDLMHRYDDEIKARTEQIDSTMYWMLPHIKTLFDHYESKNKILMKKKRLQLKLKSDIVAFDDGQDEDTQGDDE